MPVFHTERMQRLATTKSRINSRIVGQPIERLHPELRNFMAHGFMMLNIGLENSHEFEVRLYQRTDSETFNLITIKTSIPRMKAASDHITEYCSHAMRLFSRIYLEKRLEDPSEGILIEPRPN